MAAKKRATKRKPTTRKPTKRKSLTLSARVTRLETHLFPQIVEGPLVGPQRPVHVGRSTHERMRAMYRKK